RRRGAVGAAGTGGEGAEDDEDNPLLPEHAAEPAGDRRRNRGADQVRGEAPRHSGRRRAEVVLNREQCWSDERLKERVGDRRRCEERKGDVVVRTVRFAHALSPPSATRT